MKKLFTLFVVFFLCGALSSYAEKNFTPQEWEAFVSLHQPIAEAALEAYNNDEAESFAENFVPSRYKRTLRGFPVLWEDEYKSEYGNFISKEIIPEKCNINKVYPMLTYKAKFEKNDKVGVRVVFALEDGEYRIFYMRFDPYRDLFY